MSEGASLQRGDASTQDGVVAKVLYDLNIHAEWPLDAEPSNRLLKDSATKFGVVGRVVSATQRSFWTFLRSVGFPHTSASPCNLPANLVRLAQLYPSWSFCLSPDGEYLAVLQDSCVEIHCRKDSFVSVIGKASLWEDNNPQWRRMGWSPDAVMLAVSSSKGDVTVLDVLGGEYFSIIKPDVGAGSGDLSAAVASMIFLHSPKNQDMKWDFKLLVANHQGLLTSYIINVEDCQYTEDHVFTFSHAYPRGICTMVYSEQHSLLIVSGLPGHNSDPWRSPAGQAGITVWRILSGTPYYKLITDYDRELSPSGGRPWLLQKVKSALREAVYGDGTQEVIYKMSISPDGKLLLALTTESKLCLFHLPSMTLSRSWPLQVQPCCEDLSPSLLENPRRSKFLQDTPFYQNLLDVEWWSNEAVILARFSGAILVSDIEKLSNLLGESPEWFEPSPQVQRAHDGGFLALECECRVFSARRKRTLSEGSDAGGDDSDSDEQEGVGISRRATRLFREALFYITDMERFEPPKRKTKLVKKTYKLVSLKSTTPEELFARKIDHEEYGEALALAKVYHLDSDLVYQRQWRKTPVSLASIHDYLRKIIKRSWVLHECLERVPENIDAMRELLMYGLHGTDLEAMLQIGQGHDDGRFLVTYSEAILDESIDEFDHEAVARQQEAKKKQRQQLLSQINFTQLSIEQKELCRTRQRILQYLDRLDTYEEILGGGRSAEKHYNAIWFEKFRSQNIVEAIVDYARAGDWRAVDIIFTYHGDHTLSHRLAILSNLPETIPPEDYRNLLPLVDKGKVVLYQQQSLREQDWCEDPERRKCFELGSGWSTDSLYDHDPDLRSFCVETLTPEVLTSWFEFRACDIERKSRLVDHALQFVELGMRRNVENLDSLRDDLVTMEMIVYDCHYNDSLSFGELRKMNDLERLKIIMSMSSIEKHPLHIQKWMRPFLERSECKTPGSYRTLLSQYLREMAVDDLQLVFRVFECSKISSPVEGRLLKNEEELLSSALECIYACERDDQLCFVLSILECLPNREQSRQSRALIKLHNEVDELELHINAAEILEKYGVTQTIASIRKSQQDADAATLLMRKLTRRANNRTPAFSTTEWTQLQSDMAALQTKVYRCIDSTVCCEIFVEGLLCSGKLENIKLASAYMETGNQPNVGVRLSSVPSALHIPFDKAVDLVVRAAMEYFNSSGSSDDAHMGLAQACLSLMSRPHEKLTAERHLMSALPLLGDFGVSMLPLHVRLHSNKLGLIELALASRKDAFRQYPKLLKMAEYLCIADSALERDGAVLRLVTQCALAQSDFKLAYKQCTHLMDSQYPDVWPECYQLASSEGFSDIEAKMALLSYSLVHCSDDMIEPILQDRMLLKTHILMKRIGSNAPEAKEDKPQENKERKSPEGTEAAATKIKWRSLFTPEGAAGALSLTSHSTKALLSNVKDMRWLGKAVSLVERLTSRAGANTACADFKKQGCHPFYEDIIEGCQCSMDLTGSATLEMSVAEDMLRISKLQQTVTRGGNTEDCSPLLLNCAQRTLPSDMTLGLGFLLALPRVEDADACFKELPHIPLVLTLASYYYALAILAERSLPLGGTVSETINLSQKVGDSRTASTAECQVYAEKLKTYLRLKDDHSQALILNKLGRSVDGHRFTADNEYKKGIILDLARSAEDELYETALRLGDKYTVPPWNIHMEHVIFLFTAGGCTSSQIEKRLHRLFLADKLKAEPEAFAKRMHVEVRSHLQGTDMQRLLLYYRLVEGAPSQEGIDPETHRKLLTKLAVAAPGLDYGAMMSGSQDPLHVIRPVLKSGNVYVFSKLAFKIPKPGGGYLEASEIFCIWAQKLFLEGPSANSKIPDSTAAWVHRYEACGEFIDKLSAHDDLTFVENILFSDKAIDTVPLEARQEVCRRNIKLCRANLAKEKKVVEEMRQSVSWETTVAALNGFKLHLDQMCSETLVAMLHSQDSTVRSYHRLLDACRGDCVKIKVVLSDMLLDGQALELVQDLLGVLPVEGWTVRDALTGAISSICQQLREGKDVSRGRSIMDVFAAVIDQVGEHQREAGGKLVNSEDVMSICRPFIADAAINLDTRLLCLDFIEKNLQLNDADQLLGMRYQTEAIVRTHWKERLISVEDVSSELGRRGLFIDLLEHSVHVDQLEALSHLFSVWPPMKNTSPLWIGVLDGMLRLDLPSRADRVVDLCRREKLSPGVLQKAYSSLKASGFTQQAIVLALHSDSPLLLDDVVDLMLLHVEELSKDTKIMGAVFEGRLLTRFVDTAMFQPLINFLAEHQKSSPALDPHQVIADLTAINRISEAKTVDKLCKRQQGLRTIDAAVGAIGAISRWWRKE